jgi:single-strand DNA-binding protein
MATEVCEVFRPRSPCGRNVAGQGRWYNARGLACFRLSAIRQAGREGEQFPRQPPISSRVVITGNLTRDPELRYPLRGHIGVRHARRRQQPRQRMPESGHWVDKPNYFDVTVFARRARTAPSTSRRAARWRSRAAQLARVGGSGRRQAAVRGYHCRHSPVSWAPVTRPSPSRTAWSSPTSQPTPPTSRRPESAAAAAKTDDIPF